MQKNDENLYKTYEHSPPHLFYPETPYMISGGTLYKRHYVKIPDAKRYMIDLLFKLTCKYGWHLEAWVILNNHYHIMIHSPEDAQNLGQLIRNLHQLSAIYINSRERSRGRKIWYNYWDTCLTYESSYFARLNYIHWNPVYHNLVKDPLDYPYSSYSRFVEKDLNWVRHISREYPFDQLDIKDDF